MHLPKSFKFSWTTTLVCVFLALVMLRASAWQWERYKFKVALVETYKSNTAAIAVPLAQNELPDTYDSLLNRKVTLSGTYDFDHEMIVLNRTSASGPGYWLLTPLKIDGSNLSIIVSRGFIPFADRTPDTWEKYSFNSHETLNAVVQKTIPHRFLVSAAANVEHGTFQRQWAYADIGTISKQLPYPVIDTIFVQRLGGPPRGMFPAEDISVDVPPSTHFGYTFEWIFLAIATLVIGFLMQAFPRSNRKIISTVAVFVLLLTALAPSAYAITDPKAMEDDVGIIEHLGQNIDLDIRVNDESGVERSLRELAIANHPIIIVPVYFSCPRLCGLILKGVTKMIQDLGLPIGKEYSVLAVSFNSKETSALAKERSSKYLADVADLKEAPRGFRFLTGTPSNINKLMEEIGFKYTPDGDEFAHTAMLAVLSPNGMISRYFYGVIFPAQEVRMALVEASQGRIGNTLDKVMYFCFRYDHLTGKYSLMVMNVVRAVSLSGAGALTALLIGLRMKERSRSKIEEHHA